MRVRPLLIAVAVLLAGVPFLARGQNVPLTIAIDANTTAPTMETSLMLGYLALVAGYWVRDVVTSRTG